MGRKLSPYNDKLELTPAQHSFYYSGIGNRGNWLLRVINAAFAPTYGEMDDILSEAHEDLVGIILFALKSIFLALPEVSQLPECLLHI
ncbi:MAG TPA: hypothetical protein DIS98_10200 [Colwellia sp.]|nr:hypothetical protein [Colwellia sp.]